MIAVAAPYGSWVHREDVALALPVLVAAAASADVIVRDVGRDESRAR